MGREWRDSQPRARPRVLTAVLVLSGCPQLLDDDFSSRRLGSEQVDASSGGASGDIRDILDGSLPQNAAGAAGAGNAAGGTGGSAGSGGSGAGSGGTAGAPATDSSACPFGTPEPITGLGLSGSLWGPALSADGLTLYFAAITASEDLYQATRPERGAAFSPAVALDTLNTTAGEGSPFPSRDGLTLYFYSSRSGGSGSRDLYAASRSSSALPFSNPSLLANVNSGSFDHLPRLSADELTLLFTSERAGGPGGANLWVATRSSTAGSFGVPEILPDINVDALNEGGGLSSDGLSLYFDSTRAGAGGHDLWMATRSTTGEPFSHPQPLSDLNTSGDEFNVSLSRDDLELLFTSNRGGSASYGLYRSLRTCP